MESTAKVKYVRITPRKARLVVDLVRGCGVEEALEPERENSTGVILVPLGNESSTRASFPGRTFAPVITYS